MARLVTGFRELMARALTTVATQIGGFQSTAIVWFCCVGIYLFIHFALAIHQHWAGDSSALRVLDSITRLKVIYWV